MTRYINPPEMTKETFLINNAEEIDLIRFKRQDKNDSQIFVVLVDNGHFTAAAIVDNSSDFARFTRPSDHRPKKFFLIDKDKLTPDLIL